MQLFKLYLKNHIKGFLAVLFFCILFTVSFILYHIPAKAALYPAALCILLSVIFIFIDFLRVKRKHQRLLKVKNLQAALISSLVLPDVESIEDKDYQEIIKKLKNEVATLETESRTKYQSMMDYYTVWVHQIKTPIASMKLNLENEDTQLSRKMSSDLFRIEQYVEMVLAYLRLDSEFSDYVFKEYSVDRIIKEAVRKFAPEFINRKIHLEYKPLTETVITDDKWLSFVLEQIISNALKYTNKGGSIKIYMKEPKTLCIEDSGIGIAPENLPRIFEKGYTGYNGRNDKRASGIGLYLCKRICKNLASEIKVESELDKGTVVSINLEQYKLKKE